MAALSPGQVYADAKAAGFSDIEAVIMTATAFVESSYNPAAGVGGSGAQGLLQFEPSTWAGTGVTCSIADPACQMTAARKLTSGSFGSSWFSNWFACEAAQGPGKTPGSCSPSSGAVQSMANIYAGLVSSIAGTVGVDAGQVLISLGLLTHQPSGGVFGGQPLPPPNPGDIIPSLPNPGNIISPILKIPGDVLGGIGGGIKDALLSVGQHLLPWLIILGVAFFALFMIAKELGATGGGSGSGGGASAAEMAAA